MKTFKMEQEKPTECTSCEASVYSKHIRWHTHTHSFSLLLLQMCLTNVRGAAASLYFSTLMFMYIHLIK